jgi:hypothetical protein
MEVGQGSNWSSWYSMAVVFGPFDQIGYGNDLARISDESSEQRVPNTQPISLRW